MIKSNVSQRISTEFKSVDDFEKKYYGGISVKRLNLNTKRLPDKYGLKIIDKKTLKFEDVFTKLVSIEVDIKKYLNHILSVNLNTPEEITGALKTIILAKPKDLKRYTDKHRSYKGNYNNIAVKISRLFNYDSLRKPCIIDNFVRLKFSTCLYCNRNFISNFKKKTNLVSTISLDHFYQKDKIPILSLSFYNLIPSCDTCNSRIKGQRVVKDYMNPHDQKYDFESKAKFKLITNNNFSLVSEDIRCLGYIRDFYINEVYKHHQNVVDVLIEKHRIYTHEIIAEIAALTNTTSDSVNSDIFGGLIMEEDSSLYPLSKLNKDIIDCLREKIKN